jgi:tetratricopeptide (TPR) repeat protein
MRKIILLLIVTIVTACSENFLERFPLTTLNEENFYVSEKEYILLANGCYLALRDYTKDSWWILAEEPSDNAGFQFSLLNSYGIRQGGVADMWMANPSDPHYQYFWNDSYSGITNCNKLLAEIDRTGVTWSKASYKDRCVGEALFLRALYYFNLVRTYGGVPIVLGPINSSDAANIKRSSDAQIYEVIIDDLNNSLSHFSNALDVEENGRANWGAAASLLGKVYLTLHQYDLAEVQLRAVIESQKYDLLTDYANLFNPANKDYKETIFAVQYSEASANLSNRFIFYFSPHTSGGDITHRPNIGMTFEGWNQPTQDLIDAFEPGDLRKDVSIRFWTGPDWDLVVRTLPYCWKYKIPISAPDDRCGDNFPVIRYSDVLLMYAEVLNELDRTSEAITYIEQVRFRAGLTESLTGYTKSTLEALIAKERQVEFCFENQRFYDLKRTGKALEVMAAHGVRETSLKQWYGTYFPDAFNIQPYKLLAPIPVTEVDINKLEQNPGY